MHQLFVLFLAATAMATGVTASAVENLKLMKEIYAQFAENKATLLVESFAPEYTIELASAAQVNPIFKSFDNIMNFLEIYGSQLTLSYNPEDVSYTVNKDQVVAVFKATQNGVLTGKVSVTPNAQIWTFNSDGKITSLLAISDTAAEIDQLTLGQTPYSLMQIVTGYYGAINAHDIAAISGYYAPGVIFTIPSGTANVTQYFAQLEGFFASFPDLQFKIVNMVANNNDVTVQTLATGTFTGAPFNGLPPTGKPISVSDILIMTVEDGKITGYFELADYYTFFSQIGALSGR